MADGKKEKSSNPQGLSPAQQNRANVLPPMYWEPYNMPLQDPLGPFSGPAMAMQGMQTMQSLPNMIGGTYGFINALNSANKQAFDQTAAPVQMMRDKLDFERERQGIMAPLLAALVGGLGGLTNGGGMSGFMDTASRQMAELPSGSAAKPVNWRG